MEIAVHSAPFVEAQDLPVEIVERKGLGHPDTLCDAIAERTSSAYSNYCLREFGGIAHHWFDKLTLYGGEARIGFGVGELLRPYRIVLYGKAARIIEGRPIPLAQIAREAASEILKERLVGFDPARHLELIDNVVDHQGTGNTSSRYRPESLADLIKPGVSVLYSNDCNVCTAFTPLSPLERSVLLLERTLFGADFRVRWPDLGTDIKVVGVRNGGHYRLFVSAPFIARLIPSAERYHERRRALRDELAARAAGLIGTAVELDVNHGDRRLYLAALGSAADTGDVGVVGRGNRPNGLITPMRPMSIEAVNGKNPTDHTGKIYGVLSQRIASRLHDETRLSNQVHLATLKGLPLTDPTHALIYVHGSVSSAVVERAKRIIAEELANVPELTQTFLDGAVVMY